MTIPKYGKTIDFLIMADYGPMEHLNHSERSAYVMRPENDAGPLSLCMVFLTTTNYFRSNILERKNLQLEAKFVQEIPRS